MGEYKYRILKEKKLVLRCMIGNVDLKNFFQNIANSVSDGDYSTKYSALYDFRDANLQGSISSIHKFAADVRKETRIHEKRKVVFLTSTPNQVATSMLLESLRRWQMFDITTVSTLDAAIRFLGMVPRDKIYLERIIKEMKSS